MSRHRYITLSSADDTNRHWSNVGTDFTVTLSQFIVLEHSETWSVALTEVELTPSVNQAFVVCSDICASSHVGTGELPTLRALYPNEVTGKVLFTFKRPYYVPVKKRILDTIRIYLTDRDGGVLSLVPTTTRVTLHLRRDAPFYET